MTPDLPRELDPEAAKQQRRRILVVVCGLIVGAAVLGVGMMWLVVAFVPKGFVDSSFVNGTDTNVMIYVNGEGRALAGPGATASNFAVFPQDEGAASPRYVVQAYTVDFERTGCTAEGGCEGELRHCATYTWHELLALNWVAVITDNATRGQRFGEVPLDRCP